MSYEDFIMMTRNDSQAHRCCLTQLTVLAALSLDHQVRLSLASAAFVLLLSHPFSSVSFLHTQRRSQLRSQAISTILHKRPPSARSQAFASQTERTASDAVTKLGYSRLHNLLAISDIRRRTMRVEIGLHDEES